MRTLLTTATALTLFSASAVAAPYTEVETLIVDGVEFRLVAQGSPANTHMGAGVRIDYKVYRAGALLPPSDGDEGGRLMGCTYKDTWAPEKMIYPLKVNDQQLGWELRTRGICGNTSSFRSHIIAVNKKWNVYAVRDVVSKTGLTLRALDGGPTEVWYSYQEWGDGGTSTSFMVPARWVLNGNYGYFERKPLPLAYESWPQLEYVSSFQSYFVAALNDLNVPLMKRVYEKLYREEDQESYGYVGLPGTREETLSLIESVRKHGGSIETFFRRR